MKIQWTVGGLAVIVAALVLALGFKSCGGSDGEKIPDRLAKTLDSLDVTRPAFTQRADSIIRIVVGDTVRAIRLERAAATAKREAEGFRQAADSLARLASTAADSATLWHSAYDARTSEAGQLRVSLDSTGAALRSERSARIHLLGLYIADTLRRSAVERANAGLRVAIAELEKPCRIAGPIPCPSRTVSFVSGVAIGVAAMSATRR